MARDKSTTSKVATAAKVAKEAAKPKRAPTAFAAFIADKVSELKEAYGEQEPKKSYMEFRKEATAVWNVHKLTLEPVAKPVKESSRPPSAYNIYIKTVMGTLKQEHASDEPKLTQKDLMKLAAEGWAQYKLDNGIVAKPPVKKAKVDKAPKAEPAAISDDESEAEAEEAVVAKPAVKKAAPKKKSQPIPKTTIAEEDEA